MRVLSSIHLTVTLLLVSMVGQAQDTIAKLPQRVTVSIFEQQRPQGLLVRSHQGTLAIVSNGKEIVTIGPKDLLYLTVANGKLRIRTIEQALGTFDNLVIRGTTDSSLLTLQPIINGGGEYTYCGSVTFSNNNGVIQSLLDIDFETYLAGVVEAEVGPKQELEMYKVQAIVARTYALTQLEKHQDDGFNLCDGVHCQAFKGLSVVPNIAQACRETHELVVVDNQQALITATFHANCGGETANSEDVWSGTRSYLRSTLCPYCAGSKSFTWRTSIPLAQWAKYLSDKGVMATVDNVARSYNPTKRKSSLKIGKVSIPTATIRKELGLRSAYFGYQQEGDSLIIKGKGYGHGIGMCQDGASEMARRGMTKEEIIAFYYKDCHIVEVKNAHKELEVQPERNISPLMQAAIAKANPAVVTNNQAQATSSIPEKENEVTTPSTSTEPRHVQPTVLH